MTLIRHIKKIIYTTLLLLCFSACEKIIEFDEKETERKICVNSIFHSDSIVQAYLSKSVSILEPDTFILLNNANIKIHNTNDSVSLSLSKNGLYNSASSFCFPGEEYVLDVQHTGLKSVSSSTFIPEPVPIIKVDTTLRYINEKFDEFYFEEYYEMYFELDFQDPENEENYYALVVKAPIKSYWSSYTNGIFEWDSTFYTYGNAEIESEDNLVLVNNGWEIDNINIFNDKLIEGKLYTLNFSINLDIESYQNKNYPIQVELRSIPKELYLYYMSYTKQKEIRDNPLSEPVQVYSNIENGYGIFAGFSSDVVSFEY